ncbi:DUF2785 domain-containing protein [Streptomyces bambusae]|uniref:DUF2785 domain-containing protein n=1 Tax=Streptomyces bambusae TaxID=1550616 RepID=A0ABS6Z7I5_9ACTN|nr:DUF2785 domain-containing protein [Streptomyces bambusae]MBW5483722.1 DUF2785 domain-containing protein [Streptomyces bambusae]
MINWDSIERSGYAVPAEHTLDELVAALSRALADPDPAVRDGAAYSVLATWISTGVIDAPRRLALGDAMAIRFSDREVQARTFAPLVLNMLVRAGDFRPAWVDAFAHWYVAETDLRGYDATLGWLHAVAHGADLLGTLGLRPEVEPGRMPALAAARLLVPADHVLDQQEDDRLATALGRLLRRPDLTEEDATAWLLPVEEAFRALGRGPVPAWFSNTVRTLRALYVLVDRDRDPAPAHRTALLARLGEVLALVDAG